MLCEPDPKLYHYVAQGMITIDNVDDAEEMKATDVAFDVLNFTAVSFCFLYLFDNFLESNTFSIDFFCYSFVARET